jgi:hypothetical protein
MAVHPANFVEWRKRARSFEALALVRQPRTSDSPASRAAPQAAIR